MLIRRMTPKDIETVVAVEEQCFSQPWSEKSFQDSIGREDTVFLVCEEEIFCNTTHENQSLIVGYIGMYISFDEANITNVAVSPAYRKKGYGEGLVKEAKRRAIGLKVDNIFLEVRVSNEPAISLYKKLGFEELGIRKNFYEHPVEDAFVMSCRLVNLQ